MHPLFFRSRCIAHWWRLATHTRSAHAQIVKQRASAVATAGHGLLRGVGAAGERHVLPLCHVRRCMRPLLGWLHVARVALSSPASVVVGDSASATKALTLALLRVSSGFAAAFALAVSGGTSQAWAATVLASLLFMPSPALRFPVLR